MLDGWRCVPATATRATLTCTRARQGHGLGAVVLERFTDRGRRVLVRAQDEARRAGSSAVGTEHILLGLIDEGESLAARALEALGISLQAVRDDVRASTRPSGLAPEGAPPFTQRVKTVLELSLREALELGHDYIGTEHVLLGLVREGEDVAAQVLLGLGAELAQLRETVLRLLAGGSATPDSPAPDRPTAGDVVAVRRGMVAAAVRTGVPRRRAVRFPEELVETGQLADVPDEARVALVDADHGTLAGVAAGAPVRVALVRRARDGRASGTVAGEALEVSWHVEEVSSGHAGPSASPSARSSSARTVTLSGTFGSAQVDLRGRFLDEPGGYFFDRAELVGELGGLAVDVTVERAEGGLGSTSTVVARGTVGGAGLELFASVRGDLTRAIVRGTFDGQRVGLDATRDPDPATCSMTGAFAGPVALVTLVAGVVLAFL